jgi:4-hydroxy-tetrahydrodipicolinate synthase
MNNYKQLSGTGVALVTPFTKNGMVDYSALQKLVNHVIKGKVEYLVVLGTTGESATLSREEKTGVYECARAANKKRIPLVLGIGGSNTAEVLNQFNHFDSSGVDAVLSVSPYYNKPSQRGIIRHFTLIANASPIPVILYNVPSRTGSNMTAETTLELATHKNIIGIKEASGNIEQCMQIIKHKPKNFLIISGDDMLTLPLIACGAQGVISVVANSHPQIFSEMVRQALKGNFEKARQLHYKVSELIPLLFAEGSPPGIKAALKKLGICTENVRLPLVEVSDGLRNRIASLITKI